ncbi:hypothetical protein [Lentzea tibetensis]|uniref:hypothetical protein n=1 Tax=Lentzea tibetensis TaxID=2591470 RepID=UPI001C99B1C7|nr:hypothetical protein [Lentzea tibetensis]
MDSSRVVDQHGSLQANPFALDQLEEIITAEPVRRRAQGTVPVGVAVPELIVAGEPLPVTAQMDPEARKALLITVVPEQGRPIAREPRIVDVLARATFEDLPPGGYELRATGRRPESPLKHSCGIRAELRPRTSSR